MTGSINRRLKVVVTLVAGLVMAAASTAHAQAPGGFSQMPAPLGCLTNGGTGGCTSIHDSVAPYGFVLSRDGRFAYSASYGGTRS